MKLKILLTFVGVLFNYWISGQSVEIYTGNQRYGIDLMWFKYIKNTHNEATPLLFFSRTRASTTYQNESTGFGSTNAISYNFKNGLGLVMVGSFGPTGLIPKAGIQYYQSKNNFMFFGWIVSELRNHASVEAFGLFRYQPSVHPLWKVFSQLELYPILSSSTGIWNFTERVRFGLKRHSLAGGLMLDFTQVGVEQFSHTSNIGVFIRNDF